MCDLHFAMHAQFPSSESSTSTPSRRADIVSVVEEYVNEAARKGFVEVRVVHGRGRGVQRGIVQAALERHPSVLEFWDDPASHLGATLVRLGRPDAS